MICPEAWITLTNRLLLSQQLLRVLQCGQLYEQRCNQLLVHNQPQPWVCRCSRCDVGIATINRFLSSFTILACTSRNCCCMQRAQEACFEQMLLKACLLSLIGRTSWLPDVKAMCAAWTCACVAMRLIVSPASRQAGLKQHDMHAAGAMQMWPAYMPALRRARTLDDRLALEALRRPQRLRCCVQRPDEREGTEDKLEDKLDISVECVEPCRD